MKQLVIIRGLPGAGKSTFAQEYAMVLHAARIVVKGPFEADQYFINSQTGEYVFDATKLGTAHQICFNNVDLFMQQNTECVIVSNTFTTERELKPYLALAEKMNYKVVSIVVENRHGNKSIHNVPDEAMDKMRNRFSLKV